MSHEGFPSDSGPSDQEAIDFALWEGELNAPRAAELTADLGDLALAQLVTVRQEMPPQPPEDPNLRPRQEHEEILPQATVTRHSSLEAPSARSSDFHLTNDEMAQAAMSLIYLTTGVPADDIYAGK